MKKFTLYLACIALCFGCLAGCKSQSPTMSAEQIASQLNTKIHFEDQLCTADTGVGEALYQIQNATDCCVYISSGATAEEIAVFCFENSNQAKQALPPAQQRIQSQIQAYQSYVPAEVARLNSAAIVQQEQYLVVCVTDDTTAKQTIEEILQ